MAKVLGGQLCPVTGAVGKCPIKSRDATVPLSTGLEPQSLDEMSDEQLRSLLRSQGGKVSTDTSRAKLFTEAARLPAARDLSEVRLDIRRAMKSQKHDGGSLAPLFIRLAWHCSGTFDKQTGTGGSNGGTMRFAAEAGDAKNKGLEKARRALDTVHSRHSWMSYADLWVLAAYEAFAATGGPLIPFATGRRDFSEEEAHAIYGSSGCPFGDGEFNPSGSRLPAADVGPDPECPASAPITEREAPMINAVRGTFRRMGIDDKEIVALIVMGHQYGRPHADISGYEGPWYAFDPFHWNVYGPGGLGYLTAYSMMNARRPELSSKGKRQWNMYLGGGQFTMIPVDLCLWWDPSFRQHITWYDRHRLEFHRDAAMAFKKLTELGCDGLLTPERTPGYERLKIDHIL